MVLHICTNPCVYKLLHVFVYKHSIVCIRTVALRVDTHLSMSTCVYLRRISCLYTRILVFVYAFFSTSTRRASTKKSCASTISGPYWCSVLISFNESMEISHFWNRKIDSECVWMMLRRRCGKVLLTMTDDIIHPPHPSHTHPHTSTYTHTYVCVSKKIHNWTQ